MKNKKIKPGKYLLTEIAGNVFSGKSKCKDKSSVFLKEAYFINDDNKIAFYDFEQEVKNNPNYKNINYYYAEINKNNNLEVYINTNNEIDEYAFEAVCFEPSTSPLLQSLNEFEILLLKDFFSFQDSCISLPRSFIFLLLDNIIFFASNVICFISSKKFSFLESLCT